MGPERAGGRIDGRLFLDRRLSPQLDTSHAILTYGTLVTRAIANGERSSTGSGYRLSLACVARGSHILVVLANWTCWAEMRVAQEVRSGRRLLGKAALRLEWWDASHQSLSPVDASRAGAIQKYLESTRFGGGEHAPALCYRDSNLRFLLGVFAVSNDGHHRGRSPSRRVKPSDGRQLWNWFGGDDLFGRLSLFGS